MYYYSNNWLKKLAIIVCLDRNMNPYLAHMTNRELLEQIYLLLLQINVKVSEIDNDAKTFGMNLAADLVGNMLDDQSVSSRKTNNE